MELIHIARGKFIAPINKLLLEDAGGAQQTGLEQRHQVKQLLHIVLHGGRREQQDIFFAQLGGELPEDSVTVAQVVCLINDHQIPLVGEDGRAVRLTLGGVERGDDPLVQAPGRGTLLTEDWVVVGNTVQAKFTAQLALPLLNQRWRSQNEGAPGQATGCQFQHNHAGLDRLAQTDLIAQERPATHTAQHSANGAKLMLQQFHIAQQRCGEQFIKTGDNRKLSGLQAEAKIAPAYRRAERRQTGGVLGVKGQRHAIIGSDRRGGNRDRRCGGAQQVQSEWGNRTTLQAQVCGGGRQITQSRTDKGAHSRVKGEGL